jgi:hypothetical protein
MAVRRSHAEEFLLDVVENLKPLRQLDPAVLDLLVSQRAGTASLARHHEEEEGEKLLRRLWRYDGPTGWPP